MKHKKVLTSIAVLFKSSKIALFAVVFAGLFASCAKTASVEKKTGTIFKKEEDKVERKHSSSSSPVAGATSGPSADSTAASDNIAAAKLANASEMPATFSALGLFGTAGISQPIGSLIPYSVKVTLWSDGLGKQRFVFVPTGKTITFNASNSTFTFPNGTIFVKHFADGSRPVETRVLVHSTDGSWKMASYQWPASGDATRVDVPTITSPAAPSNLGYRLPAPNECVLCHASSGPVVLGFEPDQLNGAASGASTTPMQDLQQLNGATARLFSAGVVDAVNAAPSRPDPSDTTLSQSLRTRAYMDLNCSTCHNPTGVASFLDFTLATGLTTDYPSALLSFQRVVPGDLADSVIWQKFTAATDRMPPVSLIQDPLAYQLLHDWISAWPVAAAPAVTPSPSGNSPGGSTAGSTGGSGSSTSADGSTTGSSTTGGSTGASTGGSTGTTGNTTGI